MKYSKKGQMSLFLIGGIVLVLLVAGMYMFSRPKAEQLKDANFQSQNQGAPEEFVESCVEETSINAIDNYGLNDPSYLQAYLDANLQKCTESMNVYKEEGYTVLESAPESKITINDETVLFDVIYPVKLTRDSEEINLEKFSFTYKRSSTLNLEEGIAEKGSTLRATDGNAMLHFSYDTRLTDCQSGEAREDLQLKVLDKNEEGQSNSVVVSEVIYDGLPDCTVFDNPAELSIAVPERLLAGYNPDVLTVAYYDEPTGVWISVPTEYDEKTSTFIGYIDHFTKYSVVVCGSRSSNKGDYMIPADGVSNGVFSDQFGDLCEPVHWNYNIGEGNVLDINSIHVAPEYMGGFSCEELEGMTNVPQLAASDCTDPGNEYVKDWDMDDAQGFMNYDFQIKYKNAVDGREIVPTDAQISYLSPIAQAASLQCMVSCAVYSVKKIKEKFPEWSVENYISGDSLRDGTTLHCIMNLAETASTTDDLYDFAGTVCDTAAYESGGVAYELNNLENDAAKVKYAEANGELSMEWVKVNYDEELETSIYNEGDKVAFFATPKTFGMTVSSDISPFVRDATTGVVTFTPENSPYKGSGVLEFDVLEDGDACLNSEDYEVEAWLLKSPVQAGLPTGCNSDKDFDRQCFPKAHPNPDDGSWRLTKRTGCIEPTPNRDAVEMQYRPYVCYEKAKPEGSETESSGGIQLAKNIGNALPIVTPLKTFITEYKARELKLTPGDEEALYLMDYKYKTGNPSLMVYDEACSDACKWTLNPEAATTKTNEGKIIAGKNTLQVEVANIKDACMYAKGYVQIKGSGVGGLDECGATIQNRINYLAGCGLGNTGGTKDKQYNCLGRLRQLITENNPNPSDPSYPQKISLCELDAPMPGTEGKSFVQNLMEKDASLASLCEGVDFSEDSSGGVCVGTKKMCRDTLDPGTDSGCTCGTEVYNTSNPAMANLKVCCPANDINPDAIDALMQQGTGVQCRGESTLGDCEGGIKNGEMVFLDSDSAVPGDEQCNICSFGDFIQQDISKCKPEVPGESLCDPNIYSLEYDELGNSPSRCILSNGKVYAGYCTEGGEDAIGAECKPDGEGKCTPLGNGKYSCCDAGVCTNGEVESSVRVIDAPQAQTVTTANDFDGFERTLSNDYCGLNVDKLCDDANGCICPAACGYKHIIKGQPCPYDANIQIPPELLPPEGIETTEDLWEADDAQEDLVYLKIPDSQIEQVCNRIGEGCPDEDGCICPEACGGILVDEYDYCPFSIEWEGYVTKEGDGAFTYVSTDVKENAQECADAHNCCFDVNGCECRDWTNPDGSDIIGVKVGFMQPCADGVKTELDNGAETCNDLDGCQSIWSGTPVDCTQSYGMTCFSDGGKTVLDDCSDICTNPLGCQCDQDGPGIQFQLQDCENGFNEKCLNAAG